MTTEKIPLHDDQAWRRQLELNNKRLLENNRILAEKLRESYDEFVKTYDKYIDVRNENDRLKRIIESQ